MSNLKTIIQEEIKNLSSLLSEDDSVLNASSSIGDMILKFLKSEYPDFDFKFFSENDFHAYSGAEEFADNSKPIIGSVSINADEGVPIDIVLIVGGDGTECIVDVIIDTIEYMKTGVREEDVTNVTKQICDELYDGEDKQSLIEKLESLGFNTL